MSHGRDPVQPEHLRQRRRRRAPARRRGSQPPGRRAGPGAALESAPPCWRRSASCAATARRGRPASCGRIRSGAGWCVCGSVRDSRKGSGVTDHVLHDPRIRSSRSGWSHGESVPASSTQRERDRAEVQVVSVENYPVVRMSTKSSTHWPQRSRPDLLADSRANGERFRHGLLLGPRLGTRRRPHVLCQARRNADTCDTRGNRAPLKVTCHNATLVMIDWTEPLLRRSAMGVASSGGTVRRPRPRIRDPPREELQEPRHRRRPRVDDHLRQDDLLYLSG